MSKELIAVYMINNLKKNSANLTYRKTKMESAMVVYYAVLSDIKTPGVFRQEATIQKIQRQLLKLKLAYNML